METQRQSPESGELQFEQAEYDADSAAQTCTVCTNRLQGYYYTANGRLICVECKEKVQQVFDIGSAPRRFFKALLFGSLASIVGAGIYYAILKISGYQFALVSILIGLMVGSAVKSGCGGRGGWVYQTLAVFLTSLSWKSVDVKIGVAPPVIRGSLVGSSCAGLPNVSAVYAACT